AHRRGDGGAGKRKTAFACGTAVTALHRFRSSYRVDMAQSQSDPVKRVPLVRETLADLDTPLSTYLKLADAPNSFLLESVQGGERWGRSSIIGLPCRERIRVHGNTLIHERDGKPLQTVETNDPLSWIQAFNDARPLPRLPGLPPLTGGLVGYFGYDTVRYIEPRPAGVNKPDPLDLPDILVLVAEESGEFVIPDG